MDNSNPPTMVPSIRYTQTRGRTRLRDKRLPDPVEEYLNRSARPAVPANKVHDLTEFFDSKAIVDCRVECKDQVWDLHRLVICHRSKFFAAAFLGSFKEAKDNVVRLHEQDPNLVDVALRCLYSGTLTHIEEEIRPVDKDMSAYRLCLQLYKLGDFLDADIICDAALVGMEENNVSWARELVKRATMLRSKTIEKDSADLATLRDAEMIRSKTSEEDSAHAALATLFEFRDAFVECAKEAYAHPKRKSNGRNIYFLGEDYHVINLGPRGLTTPFIHLMLFFKENYSLSPASADLIRKLQEVPELLGDMLVTFAQPP